MNKLFRKLTSYFFGGLLFIAPVGITFYILFSAFKLVDNFGQFITENMVNKPYLAPGLGFALVISSILLLGFIFTKVLPSKIQTWFENKMANLPVIKIFYSASKDLISAFWGEKKKFSTGVLVTINYNPEVKKIGFLTQETLDIFDLPEMVSVYCPHAYAISGQTFVVSRKDIQILNVPSTELMKMAISGGVSIGESK